ncbi:TraR/DksA family transcriptional regulator [Streptomyces sp. NRRL F-2580]|uniref:TraR/DksA family transcriptional regulator n=1 Tax=Streptomyces sp. NRRL F-2580 TaxID=1463841 RepID=UPI0004C56322|nr:TraR/DksA C4-type zinc finger protein [Streptomyces sp. NRRL F-2580]
MVAKKTAGSTAKKAVGKAAGKAEASEDTAPARKATAAGKAAAATKAPAKKAAAKKAPPKTTAVKKAPVKTTAVKTTAVKSTAVKKVPARKAPADKATTVTKTTAVDKRTVAAKQDATEGAAHAAKKTGVRKVVAKKSTGTARKTAAAATSGLPKVRATAALTPGELAVRPGEDPWTQTEVDEARSELTSEVLRLRAELDASEVAISGLMRDSGDGAGDDQADTGTKNITRESELALAANATSMLEQTERALERLAAGTYGLCENCGQPIGKARMQAFPRATLCVDCKQKQERRH